MTIETYTTQTETPLAQCQDFAKLVADKACLRHARMPRKIGIVHSVKDGQVTVLVSVSLGFSGRMIGVTEDWPVQDCLVTNLKPAP